MKNFFSGIFPSCLLLTTLLHAATGDLDPGFADTGLRRIGFNGGNDQAFATALQPDGKLLMGGASGLQVYNGTFSVVRFDTNNVLDATFGEGGRVVTEVNAPGIPGRYARINALRVQADGKIVAAGYANVDTNRSDFTLVRYHPNGAIDTAFGTNGNGIVYTAFTHGSVIRAMIIQGDGRIVVAGYTNYPANAGEGAVALARYTTNGVLDGTFGTGGRQITSGVIGYTGAHSLLQQADGKLLAVGIGIGVGHNGIDFALYRYTTNGTLDGTFGGGTGRVFTQISTNNNGYFDTANAVAIQAGNDTIQNPDKIVVAGSYYTGFPGNKTLIALARYSMDGVLDNTFGNGGIVTNTITGADTAIGLTVSGFASQPRRIIIGGYSTLNGTNHFTMARYTAAGALDTAFGGNGTGWILVPIPGSIETYATAMAVQSGRYVLAGYSASSPENHDFTALRFNNDGTRDTNFGPGGILTADIAHRTSAAKGVAVQSDGKIVVAGYASNGGNDLFALARFLADGSFDNSFGSGGQVKTKLGSANSGANAVIIQPDGRLLAAGYTTLNGNRDFAVIRYLENGTLDPSFGTNGISIISLAVGSDDANAITLQADGKLLVAGVSHNGANLDFAVVRLTANGLLDNSFDADGKVTTAIATGNDYCHAVKVQADGKIVLAGYTEINANYDIALARYNTNGALDNSFGSFGRVATDIGTSTVDGSFSMLIQTNGRIVVAGYTVNGVNVDVVLVRYLTNGFPDSSFDGDGKTTTPIGLATDYANAITLQADGKLMVAGASVIGAHAEFAALRFHSDGTLDGSFAAGGRTVMPFQNNAENIAYAIALDSMGRAVIAGDAGGLFGIARVQGDPFLKILSITHMGNGNKLLKGVGLPNAGHTLNASPTVNPGAFSPLAPITADGLGAWQYQEGSVPGVSNRFYRLSYP